MDWKTINKADSVAYIALAILGYAIPNISYKVFLLDFSAELSSSVAVDLVRAESTILLFLATCFFLLGNGEKEPFSKPLHSSYYNFNDDLIEIGRKFWVALVEDRLPKL